MMTALAFFALTAPAFVPQMGVRTRPSVVPAASLRMG